MSVKINQGESSATFKREAEGARWVPIFIPKGGYTTSRYPADIWAMKRLCKVVSISFNSEELDSRDVFEVGKTLGSTNSGIRNTITVEGFGGAIELAAAFSGVDYAQSPIIEMSKQYTNVGDLLLLNANADFTAIGSILFQNIDVNFNGLPSIAQGVGNFTFDLTTSTRPIWSGRYVYPVKEIFYDDGTNITNSNAPDGTQVTFKLGNGNLTGIATAGPLAVKYNTSGSTDFASHIVRATVAGTDVTSGITYNATAGTLVFCTAPADGAKLEVLYFLESGADEWEENKEYGVGAVVLYEGNYYKADAVAAAGTTPAGVSPWFGYIGFGYDGSAGIGDPVIPYLASNRANMFESINTAIAV